MNEKQYAVLLTETQDVRIIACNPEREMFDIAREAIGCDWIELVEAEPLAKDDLLMMIDEEGKLKPGGALINATASALYGTQQHGDPIMGNAVVVRTNGENLELLTAGEAKQLAARMETCPGSGFAEDCRSLCQTFCASAGTRRCAFRPATALQKGRSGEIIMAEKEKRLVQHNFRTTESEARIMRKKMDALGITNESAYMRALALNGYILKLDLPQIREMIRLLSNMTNNLNQIARRLNAQGQMYDTEMEEMLQKQDELWQMMRKLLSILERTGLKRRRPTMKTLLRIALAPVMLVLRLMLGLAAFVTSIASSVIGLSVTLFALLAGIEFFIGYWQNGIAFLVLALLASPVGLPAIAHLLLNQMDRILGFVEGLLY